MDRRCKVLLVMGKNDPKNSDPYKQQSVLIVPLPHPGVKIVRHTTVMGYDVRDEHDIFNCRTHLMDMLRSYLTMFVFQKRTWSSEKDEDSKSFKADSVLAVSTIGIPPIKHC